MYTHCRICRRRLKSVESQKLGIGPTCRRRLGVVHLKTKKVLPYEEYELDEGRQYKLFEGD